MLINLIYKIIILVGNNRKKIKPILILIAPFILLFSNKKYPKINNQFLVHTQNIFNDLLLKKPVDFPKKAPHETICIVIPPEYKKFSYTIQNITKYISIRTRAIKVTNKNIKQHFYLKIFLRPSNSSYLEVSPLSTTYCDLNFLVLFKHFIQVRLKWLSLDSFFRVQFENAISVTLNNSPEGYSDLMKILRYCMNPVSFTRSNFYYIPLSNSYLHPASLFLFVFVIIAISLFNTDFNLNPASIVILSILFYFCPLVFIWILRLNQIALYMIPFSAINIKYTFIYSLISYFIILYQYFFRY